MAKSSKDYTSQEVNRSRSRNQFLRPKNMTKSSEITKEKKDRLISWITFYRLNVHRFIQHYLGIKLYPYQILWIWGMGVKDSFFTVASRSVAKSWLIGLYAVSRCILYPNSKVVIVSSTMAQAAIIISEKIQGMCNDYPNVAREILTVTTGQNKHEVLFYNGSVIKVVASRDSARGKEKFYHNRKNFTLLNPILEEFVK